MEQVLDFVGRHGGPIVFVTVFLDQLGLPIPTIPILLAFGALAGTGQISPLGGLLMGVVASVVADLVLFQLGRWKGARLLASLCRVSLEPDTCVSKTHELFHRHGLKSLLVAKFIPGFDTVAPPIAGMVGVGVLPFITWSAAGALLWLGPIGGLGYLFSDRIEDLAAAADRFGFVAGLVVVGLMGLYLGHKVWERQRVLASIRTARITPEELHGMITRGDGPVIFDARSPGALLVEPFVIEGAQSLTLEDMASRPLEVPREKEIVVYCS